MFGFDLTGCERLEVVSTLLEGSPSCVESAVIRAYYDDGREPREIEIVFGRDRGPMWETLDAQVADLNRLLARLRRRPPRP